MREIGDTSVEQHLRVGQLAAELRIDRVVVIGEGARPIFAGAEPLLGQNARWVSDTATAIELLEAELGPNDIVLVKASRAIALERVANALVQQVPGKDSDL
jgi:UDP-N-acetylmuramoyl-tripeptide--D-alanyl-D-alanine ligase